MNEDRLYENVILSLTRWIEDFRLAEMPESEYINWDAHAQISELPQHNIIGLAGCGFSEDEPKSYSFVFSIAVSTWVDPGLHILTSLVSKLRGRLRPETRIAIWDADTQLENSWLITATPQAVLPVSRAETRSVQAIEVHALLDPGAASSLR